MIKKMQFLQRATVGGILAFLLLWFVDLCRLQPVEPEEFEALAVLLRRLFLLGAAVGGVLGLLGLFILGLEVLGGKLGKRPQLLPAFFLAVGSLPYLFYLSSHLLSGARMAKMGWIDLARLFLPWVMGALVFLGLYWALKVSAWARGKGLGPLRWLGGFLLTVAVLFQLLDFRLYPGLYLYLHDFLFAGGAAVGTFGLLCFIPEKGKVIRWSALILIVLPLAFFGDRRESPTIHQRSILFRQTTQGRRVLGLWNRAGADHVGLFNDLSLSADFQANRRQVKMRLDGARLELALRLGAQPVKNILWITIDTLRADHLSAYGYKQQTSPNMDALAKSSALFLTHYAQFPITSFSFQSMFFSRYPSATPLFRLAKNLPDDKSQNISFAQQLTDQGFKTISFPAIGEDGLTHPHYESLALGFQELNPGAPAKRGLSAEDQSRYASQRLRGLQDDRFFMWVHFMDPHAPYLRHEVGQTGGRDLNNYDSEIAYVDQAIGTLLQTLKTLGLDQTTAVVINADHGEAFGEHNSKFHGTTLYDEQLRIPCLIHVPKLGQQSIKAATNNVDLMPTLLDLVGLKPRTPMQGQSLVGYLMDGDATSLGPLPFAYAEIPEAIPEMSPANTNKQMIVEGRFKLLANQRNSFVELYDLEADPLELKNIADREPEIRDRLLSVIKSLQHEGKNLNLPPGSKSEEDILADLRVSLMGGTVPSRSQLLKEHLRRNHPEMVKIALERLEAPEEHDLVKLTILEHGGDLLGDLLLPYMRQVLTSPPNLGAAALVLDLWKERKLPLLGSDIELVAANMKRHPHVGWRAAILLAEHGDLRAKMHMIPALALGDRETRFASACGLGLIEDGEGLSVLRRDFVFFSHDTRRCTEAIVALTKLEDRSCLPSIVEVVKNRYLHYQVKLAAMDYFLSLDGDAGLSGLMYLSSGWDPDVDKKIFSRVKEKFGTSLAEVVRVNGRLVSEINDLIGQNQSKDALSLTMKLITSMGGSRFCPSMSLVAGQLALSLGQTEDADRIGQELAGSDVPEVYRKAAARLRVKPLAQGSSIEILEVVPVKSGPLMVGAEENFLVRLRNSGKNSIDGGIGRSALNLSIKFSGDYLVAGRQTPASHLPIWGLAPGDEVEVIVAVVVPGPGQFFQGSASVFRKDGKPVLVTSRPKTPQTICTSLATAGGLNPREQVFDGERFRSEWFPSPALYPGVVNQDKSVTYLAVQLDPILVSPRLMDLGKPLRVSIDFDNEKLPVPVEELVEVYYRYAGQPHFLGHQCIRKTFKLGGKRQKMSFDIPVKGGKAPEQIRIDPVATPHLITIHEVRIATI